MRDTAAAASVVGNLPWTRVRKTGGGTQTVFSGAAPAVTWDDFYNDYPATFTLSTNSVAVNEDGVYSILLRLFWDSITDSDKVEAFFGGIDPDSWANYTFPGVYAGTYNTVTTAHMVTRIAAGEFVRAFVLQQSGFTWRIDGGGGTYMELIKLGSATMFDRTAT